nr:phosphatase PAP2 family protein [Curvibacter sp. CHRR-16]
MNRLFAFLSAATVTPSAQECARDPIANAPSWHVLWLVPLGLLLGAPLWLHWLEPGMFLAINGWGAALPAAWWVAWSDIGNAWMVLAASAPLLLLAPRLLWGWLCAAPFAMVLARLGKDLIESPRPAAVVDNSQMRVVGEWLHNVSMPSGHTLTAFAVVGGIYFALPALRRWRYGWLWLLAGMTGLARIAVGAHWPGDVAVGACLGLLAAVLGHRLLLVRMGPQWLQARHWGLRAVAALMLVAVYIMLTDEIDFPDNALYEHVLAAWASLWLLAYGWRVVVLGRIDRAKRLKAS